MTFLLKKILPFLFRKPLNGMIFAERERERERAYYAFQVSHYVNFSGKILNRNIVFIQCCGVFICLML